MTTDEFETVMRHIRKHAQSLQLCCAWEYSLARNVQEIVRCLGDSGIHPTSILSNGNILPEGLAEAVVDAQIDRYGFSIGEERAETYERLRPGGSHERVLRNISRLVDARNEKGSDLPVLYANLTLVRSNIEELPGFVDLAASVGLQMIVGRHLILNEGLDTDGEVISDPDRANHLIEKARSEADRHGITFSVPPYPGRKDSKGCRAPWNQLYISSTGDVSVCPRIHRYAKVGNLIRQDLADVVRSREMRDLRREFITGEFTNPVCGICMANRETEVRIDQGF